MEKYEFYYKLINQFNACFVCPKHCFNSACFVCPKHCFNSAYLPQISIPPVLWRKIHTNCFMFFKKLIKPLFREHYGFKIIYRLPKLVIPLLRYCQKSGPFTEMSLFRLLFTLAFPSNIQPMSHSFCIQFHLMLPLAIPSNGFVSSPPIPCQSFEQYLKVKFILQFPKLSLEI